MVYFRIILSIFISLLILSCQYDYQTRYENFQSLLNNDNIRSIFSRCEYYDNDRDIEKLDRWFRSKEGETSTLFIDYELIRSYKQSANENDLFVYMYRRSDSVSSIFYLCQEKHYYQLYVSAKDSVKIVEMEEFLKEEIGNSRTVLDSINEIRHEPCFLSW